MAKKIALVSEECVACGSCLKACPLHAVSIVKGSHATIDAAKCVGCGKCQAACPASVITITERKEF